MTGARQEHRIRQGKGAAEPILEIVPRESADAHARAEAIRVVIATDLSLYRDVLARILARGERIEVIATATSAEDAVVVVDELRPHVLLLDAAIPGGSHVIGDIAQAAADTKVVVVAVPANDDDIIAYAAAGASGFVGRTGSPSELLAAVESAARGELLYPPEVAETWRKKITAADPSGNHWGRQPDLTQRELQVVELVERGLSNKEIAQALAITLPTVKNHVHAILKKLAVRRRAQAAARVREWRRQSKGRAQ
jgi:two-component system, NarL family, nitrate/nitrite response regulator NarL